MLEPDLFDVEAAALAHAKAAHDDQAGSHRFALGELIAHYERLMRETRRLIRRSDRAEREMNQLNRQLHELTQQLEYRATHDSLTGVFNRGAFIESATAALAQSETVLIVLDIDHFKRVNDDFGHPAGDAVIQAIVKCLGDILGRQCTIGRVGGEEFSVAWQNESLESAILVAQRLCDMVAQLRQAKPVDRPVTVSIGVSWSPPGTDFALAYGRADEALYEAKRNGRNQVRFSALDPTSNAA